MSRTHHLDATLHRANTLRRVADAAAACGLAASALLLAALIAVSLDAVFAFSPAGLIVIDSVLVAACLAALAWVAAAWLRNRYDPRRVARLLESRVGVRDSRFINAVDLAAGGSGSVALRELAITRGEGLAATVAAFQAVDRRAVRRSVLTTATVVLAIALIGLLVPRLFGMVLPRYLHPTADLPPFTLLTFSITTEPDRIYFGKQATVRAAIAGPFVPDAAEVVFIDGQERDRVRMHRQEAGVFVLPIDRAERSRRYYVETEHGRSYTQELTVLPVPRFEQVTVRYDHPAYTGWPAVERPLDGSGIRGLIGTKVTVAARSNLSLRKASFAIAAHAPSGRAAVMTMRPLPDEPRVASGSFELTENGGFTLTLIASDGTPGDETLSGPIVVAPDRPPSVQLLSPDLRINAPEGWKVPIDVAASDDIGVRKAVLRHRVNDTPGAETELTLDHQHPTYAAGSATLDLAVIGAKPGDTVRGFVTAFDSRPDPAQSADSPAFEVRVLTREEYGELARQEYDLQDLLSELEQFAAERQQLDETREKLIEELESLSRKAEENGGRLGAEDRERAEELRKQLEEFGKQSEELARRLDERAEQMALYDFEPAVQKQLKETAEQLRQQAESAGRVGSGLSDPSRENLDAALEQLRKDRTAAGQEDAERELTDRQLRQLELADRIMAEADGVMAIAERQRELAERLSPYRSATEPLGRDERSHLQRLAAEQRQLEQELTETLERMEKAAGDGSQDLPKMSTSAREMVQKIRQELSVQADQSSAASHAQASRGADAFTAADSAATKLESLIGECNGMCQGGGDDLDGILNMTRSQIANALSQLSGARRGRGQGAGSGFGAGMRAGTGTGASGTQAGGAPSHYSLMGPHSRQQSGKPTARVNLRTGTYNNLGQGFGAAAATDAQRLDPDAPDADPAAAGGPPGVPLQYRRLAEQYFRRLAEDNK